MTQSKLHLAIILASFSSVVQLLDPKTKDPNYHIATSHHMTIKQEGGAVV